MKKVLMVLLALTATLGCARVRMEAPKDPIKLDVTMRLDIYQHIKNDIDDIENIVAGEPEKAKTKGSQSLLNILVSDAYAAEGLSPEVEAAALRRKERHTDLVALEEQGILGENRLGLLELRKSVKKFAFPLNDENNDRMIIYRAVAKKNGSSLEEVQKLYAKRLQADAPAGTPIEVDSGWIIKK